MLLAGAARDGVTEGRGLGQRGRAGAGALGRWQPHVAARELALDLASRRPAFVDGAAGRPRGLPDFDLGDQGVGTQVAASGGHGATDHPTGQNDSTHE